MAFFICCSKAFGEGLFKRGFKVVEMKMQSDSNCQRHDADRSNPLLLCESSIAYGRGETILLADADQTLLKLGKTMLEKLNYRVLTAGSCEEVITRCSSSGIDLVILDTVLARHARTALLDRVREIQPDVRTLYCSVYGNSLDTQCCAAVEGEQIVFKPYTVSTFSQAITRILHLEGQQAWS